MTGRGRPEVLDNAQRMEIAKICFSPADNSSRGITWPDWSRKVTSKDWGLMEIEWRTSPLRESWLKQSVTARQRASILIWVRRWRYLSKAVWILPNKATRPFE